MKGKVIKMNGHDVPVPHGTELSKLLRKVGDGDDNYEKRMEAALESAMDKAAEMEYQLFEKGVRENATPPVTGELTPGKMKWRGIQRCYNRETGESWLEQRGKRITEVFTLVWK
jgi:hypothetical protein